MPAASEEGERAERVELVQALVARAALAEAVRQCAELLRERRTAVETGGLTIGSFDGQRAFLEELLLDDQAEGTPMNIRLSPAVFTQAEQRVRALKREYPSVTYAVLGTWHGHPGVGNSPSSTDLRTLFQEPMRLRTNDPGTVQAPYVHLIFQDFARTPERVRAFTMRLACAYILQLQPTPAHTLVTQWEHFVGKGSTLGLLWSEGRGQALSLRPYHPDTFKQHQRGKGEILGLWKYYPYASVHHEFEKVFLENFYQKLGIRDWAYVRLLAGAGGVPLHQEWFDCHRDSDLLDEEQIVRFTEIPLQPALAVTCQNPETIQTVALVLPEDSTVRDIAVEIAARTRLANPPAIFGFLREKEAQALTGHAPEPGAETVLPDDLTLAKIMAALYDPELPLSYRTLEVGAERLVQLRTLRFRDQGYAIDRLQQAHVLIGGAGILGNELAFNLAILGVGHITLIDNGTVDWNNIYRQLTFSRHDVYRRKVDVIKERLEDMGGVKVEPLFLEVPCWGSRTTRSAMLLALETLDRAVTQAEIVVGAFDRFSPRAVLQAICLVRRRPFVVSALDRQVGRVQLFEQPEDGCYCCGRVDPVSDRQSDGGACTLASLESQRIVASLTAWMVVERIQSQVPAQNRIDFYPQELRLERQRVRGARSCYLCGAQGAASTWRGEDLEQAILSWLALAPEERAD